MSLYLVVTMAVKMNCPDLSSILNANDTRVRLEPSSRECSCMWDEDTTGVRFTLSRPEAEKALEAGARVFSVAATTVALTNFTGPWYKWPPVVSELHRESKTTFKIAEKGVEIK